MSFMPELDNLSLDELIARFHRSVTGHAGYEDIYYSEIAHQIWFQHDEAGKAFLLEKLERVRDDAIRLNTVLASLWFLPPHDLQLGYRSTSSTSIMPTNKVL
jgi:hypothetical protein